ncbi:hypothetical protein OAG11_06990, partial [Verrucomicrobia bacterium]|nr:hypothetical protein [Verrucomicrobiota bacterium]
QHARERGHENHGFDPFPSRMVMWSLFAMGAWMGLLGTLGEEGRTVVLSFAAFLVLLGTVIRGIISRILTREQGAKRSNKGNA